MDKTLWEILLVFLLTVLNGCFTCSEIALITIRKTRVNELAQHGDRRAKVVLELQQNPEKLFATIQIGISLITIFASAFAGVSIASRLASHLANLRIGFLTMHAYAVSFAIIVLVLAYVNLMIGELVPKSLGLRYAERFALWAAYPIWWLSKITYILVKVLTLSANLLLKPFHDSASFTQPKLSEEEIRSVIAEGKKMGTIEPHEHSIIENVFGFTNLTVGKIMVPRTQIVAFDVEMPAREMVAKAVESGYSRVPVFQDTLNNIVGILYTKKLLSPLLSQNPPKDIRDFLLSPYFVPEAMKIGEVLQRLQRKKLHMALVTDEHGEIEGLVTMEDLVEEIVGEISDETDEPPKDLIQQADGTYLVSGEYSVVDLNKYLEAGLPENEEFSTISGFILSRLGHFPREGESVSFESWEFIVKEKTLRTVKTALVKKK